MNLYKIKTTEILATFYVVAKDPDAAAKMVEKQWKDWKYLGEGKALHIEVMAQDIQYGYPRNTWLLIEGRGDGPGK